MEWILGQSSGGRDQPSYFQVVGSCRETEICREGCSGSIVDLQKGYCVDHQNFRESGPQGDNPYVKGHAGKVPASRSLLCKCDTARVLDHCVRFPGYQFDGSTCSKGLSFQDYKVNCLWSALIGWPDHR